MAGKHEESDPQEQSGETWLSRTSAYTDATYQSIVDAIAAMRNPENPIVVPEGWDKPYIVFDIEGRDSAGHEEPRLGDPDYKLPLFDLHEHDSRDKDDLLFGEMDEIDRIIPKFTLENDKIEPIELLHREMFENYNKTEPRILDNEIPHRRVYQVESEHRPSEGLFQWIPDTWSELAEREPVRENWYDAARLQQRYEAGELGTIYDDQLHGLTLAAAARVEECGPDVADQLQSDILNAIAAAAKGTRETDEKPKLPDTEMDDQRVRDAFWNDVLGSQNSNPEA